MVDGPADVARINRLVRARSLVWRRDVADLETPVAAFLKLAHGRPNSFLLESVEGGASRGRYSIIGLASPTRIAVYGHQVMVLTGHASVETAVEAIKLGAHHYLTKPADVDDVLVAPTARRRGLARRLTESICAWGAGHGARFAYLQVVATNHAALPLYAQLGFETVYTYAYRVP